MALPLLLLVAEVSFVMVDRATGETIRDKWEPQEQAAAVGSLVKPFLALAYGQRNGFRYPVLECASGCWYQRGHGRVGVEHALGHSCNIYFRQLADGVSADDVSAVTSRLGLAGPPRDASGETLIGLGSEWRVAPVALVRAYRELVMRKDEPGIAPILNGMRIAATSGTGLAVGREALVKTGTAPCIHGNQPGDGFAVAVTRDVVVLVRVEGRPGSYAAAAAGELLRGRK